MLETQFLKREGKRPGIRKPGRFPGWIMLFFGLLAAGAVSAQSVKVVVIPMLDTRVVFTGVGQTGDTMCSEFKASPGNWQQVDCASLPVGLKGEDAELESGANPIQRFTDNGDGTITDELTSLIWLQNAFCAQGTVDWATALGYVVELNTSGSMNSIACGDVGSNGDWRLPNVKELQTLLEYGNHASPFISPAHPFTNLQVDEAYWTSTNYGVFFDLDLDKNLLDDAVRVNFNDAVSDGSSKNGLQHVWAVRSGI